MPTFLVYHLDSRKTAPGKNAALEEGGREELEHERRQDKIAMLLSRDKLAYSMIPRKNLATTAPVKSRTR